MKITVSNAATSVVAYTSYTSPHAVSCCFSTQIVEFTLYVLPSV